MTNPNIEFESFDINKLRSRSLASNVISLNDDFLLLDNFEGPLANADDDLDPFQVKDHVIIGCAEGTLKFRVNWQEMEIGQYDLLAVRPGYICQMQSMKNCRLVVFSFSDSFAEQKVDSRTAMLFMQNMSKLTCSHLSKEQFSKIVDMYRSMRSILELPNFNFKEMALNGLMQVWGAFACQWVCDAAEYASDNQKSYSNQQKLFDRFLDLVVEYHDRERSVMFYANKLCITPKYLSQVVVRVSGRYAVDIIRDQVIFKAKALLRSRQYTVQQVADILSFPNPSFFGKYFRQEVGMSPRQYMFG